MTEHWYFTFMHNQHHISGRYVRLEGTCGETLAKINGAIGTRYGFQYNEIRFIPQIERYHYTEINLQDLIDNPSLLESDRDD